MLEMLSRQRVCFPAAILVCACLCAGAACAQDADAVTRTNRTAYASAMKCFVVNGLLAGRERDAGDKARQGTYEANARQSFDIAEKLGQTLGYSDNRVTQDFGLAQTDELPKLVTDSTHLKQTMATCKALGLM